MPFPLTLAGTIDAEIPPGAALAPEAAATAIGAALRALAAVELRVAPPADVAFTVPLSAVVWRANWHVLQPVSRGEARVTAPDGTGRRVRVAYRFALTRLVAVSTAAALAFAVAVAASDGPGALARRAGWLVLAWAALCGAGYLGAWLRLPLLLKRAAEGAAGRIAPAA